MESKTRTVGATILLVAKVVNLLEEDEIESSISWDDHLKRLVVECLDISELQLHPSPYLAKSASGTVICFEGWSDDEQRKVQKAFLHITGTNPGYGTRVEWGPQTHFSTEKTGGSIGTKSLPALVNFWLPSCLPNCRGITR